MADRSTNRIYKIRTDGTVTILAGSGQLGSRNDNGSLAEFNSPYDVEVDEFLNVYVVDSGNNLIRKIDPVGHVSTFADGASDTVGASSFNDPRSLAADSYGNLYLADYGNQKLRKIRVVSDLLRFSIEVEDAAGNRASTRVTSDNSSISIDLEKPILTTVEVSSNNDNSTTLAKVNDNITFKYYLIRRLFSH